MWWRWFESWFPSWNLGWDRFWWMFYIASKWQGFRRNNLRFQCFRCFWTTVPGRRFNAWWQPRPMGPPPLSSRAGQTMQNMKHLVVLSQNLSLTWPLLQEWSPRGGGVSGGQVLRLRGAGFWFWTRKNYFVVNMNICEQAGRYSCWRRNNFTWISVSRLAALPLTGKPSRELPHSGVLLQQVGPSALQCCWCWWC